MGKGMSRRHSLLPLDQPAAKNSKLLWLTASGRAVFSRADFADDKRLHFGSGDSDTATVEVSWPSGVRQTLRDVRADQFLEIREPEQS